MREGHPQPKNNVFANFVGFPLIPAKNFPFRYFASGSGWDFPTQSKFLVVALYRCTRNIGLQAIEIGNLLSNNFMENFTFHLLHLKRYPKKIQNRFGEL